MSNRKLAKAIQNLSREIQRLHRNFNRALMNWLLRSAFVSQRRGQSAVAGFLLPTITLLLLVVTLTVGAMTIRAFDRNTQVIAEAQQKVIYNAATPAVDRARAKLEFMFDRNKDTRYPGGVPGESRLLSMMTNDGVSVFENNGAFVSPLTIKDNGGNNVDPYTLPDEARVDAGQPNGVGPDGEARNDNTWRYRADTDGDGKSDATVFYSVLFKTPRDQGDVSATRLLLQESDKWKADRGIVRSAPISNQSKLTGCGGTVGTRGGITPEAWFEDQGGDTSTIRKNFQVDALVIPDKPKAAAATIEFQQDRQIRRGNKWGAWFRYDLEIFPGPQFNWNGAMHTESNLMFGNNSFNAYLISSPSSCLYQEESSEISVTRIAPRTDLTPPVPEFVGQAIVSMLDDRRANGGRATIHVPPDNGQRVAPTQLVQMNNGNDASSAAAARDVASNPASIVLTETTRSTGPDSTNLGTDSWGTVRGNAAGLGKRILNKPEPVPYVDDLYRADDRYGPKPKYRDGDEDSEPPGDFSIPPDRTSGDDIPAGNPLIADGGNEPSGAGLDGYWERRAYGEGLRILVGERLELGNLGGWVTPRDVSGNGFIEHTGVSLTTPRTYNPRAAANDPTNTVEFDGDPLYPPSVAPYPFASTARIPHVTQQRRSLRDNLPAVQAAAIYHAAVGDRIAGYPVACVEATVHPGTIDTLRQSTNYMPTSFKTSTGQTEYLLSDFFTGRGTDGWEFAPPAGNVNNLRTQLVRGTALRTALDNLAHFAGELDGAYPPRQEAGRIHPYPALTMWGNYSNLRRALKNLDDRGGYDRLSVADKTYIHTAACTIGMLAYEIDQVQRFDPTEASNNGSANGSTKVMEKLAERLLQFIDGDVTNGEVLAKAQLATYGYNSTAGDNPSTADYNARDYDNVPPESYIAALKQEDVIRGRDYLNDPEIRLAELIMIGHQIRRDRTFGFRPSPAFGEYALRFNNQRLSIYPTACDPDLFSFNGNDRSPLLDPKATDWQLKPINVAATVPAANAPSGLVSDLGKNTSAYRLALSRLCGGLRVPAGYDPNNGTAVGSGGKAAAAGDFSPATRPVVMPKFPALYYLFPETEHGLTGAFVNHRATGVAAQDKVADRPGEWDHRQPGAISPDRNNTVSPAPTGRAALNPATNDVLLAGLDPYDREPYVIDPFIRGTVGTHVFTPVSRSLPAGATGRLKAYPTPLPGTAATATINPVDLPGAPSREVGLVVGNSFSRLPYSGSSPFPTDDLAVADVALTPRRIDGYPNVPEAALLPNYEPRFFQADASPNIIQIPKAATPITSPVTGLAAASLPTKPWAVPFLDRAIFDGRQMQVARVTDIDLGMLRQSIVPNQTTGNTPFSNGSEPWLPMSGVVYAFREDAVREDAIERPSGGVINAVVNTEDGNALKQLNDALVTSTAMNVTEPQPNRAFDPIKQRLGVSIKAIDHLPDPDRRIHGFRLRNGVQLKRNPSILGNLEESKNNRGLSFFTDQPVYMQGDFNLHEEGTGNENGRTAFLEEFVPGQHIFATNAGYNFNSFYNNRTTQDPKFASLKDDRWRPAEILADAITVLSNDFCDGSIADAFVESYGGTNNRVPVFNVNGNSGLIAGVSNVNRALYGSPIGSAAIPAGGLYQQGCTGNGATSFMNHNRPESIKGQGQNWEWKREGGSFITPPRKPASLPWEDGTAPIQIGRLGEPLLEVRPSRAASPAGPVLAALPANYGLEGLGQDYVAVRRARAGGVDDRRVSNATATRINSIVVSGITPSRQNESYGGLHNFPRFLENWDGTPFFYSGSFLQLNFSNYATGPFELEGWEPGQGAIPGEVNAHYSAPDRVWGYDVALQLAPAGPAAARFVTQSPNRSEFYTEPAISDPYIRRLCLAARQLVGTPAVGAAEVNCPSQL
jgi:hypothetical protein